MFIKRLKILIDEKCNGKQSVLAEKSGLPRSVISSYFCRGSQPSLSQLISLSSALDCTIDYLAGTDPDIEDAFPSCLATPSQSSIKAKELLEMFQSMDNAQQEQILEYARYIATRK